MDPDANLNEQLELATKILEASTPAERDEAFEDAGRLAELVISMNEWLTHQGFLPKVWMPS